MWAQFSRDPVLRGEYFSKFLYIFICVDNGAIDYPAHVLIWLFFRQRECQMWYVYNYCLFSFRDRVSMNAGNVTTLRATFSLAHVRNHLCYIQDSDVTYFSLYSAVRRAAGA